MIKSVNKKKLITICVMVFLGVLASLTFTIITNIVFPQPTFCFSFERFIAITLLVSSIACLIYYREYFAKNLHKAFLLIALSFGVSFTLVFPQVLYVSPDDQIHFRNIYFFTGDTVELTGGFAAIESSSFANMGDKGFDELSTMYEMMDRENNTVIAQDYQIPEVTPLYKRIVYLPYYIGLKIANIMHLDFVAGIITSKICNLICYVVLVYFAIRESGRFRKIFFATGLLMSNIYLVSQFSYDPMIIASLLLAISLFLHICQSETVSSRHLWGFILVVVWGSLTKAIYCPLLLLVLMIPNKKFDSRKRAVAFKICSMLVMVVLASTFVLPILGGSMVGDVRGGSTSVSGQLQFMLSNPLRSVAIIANFLVSEVPTHLIGAVMLINLGAGSTSGAIYEICLPAISLAWAISLVTILWATFTTDGGAIITNRFKLKVAFICATLIGMIFISLYLSFTGVGSMKVDGVQPRYYMPFYPLLLMLLVPINTKIKENTSDKIILFAPCAALTIIFGIYVICVSMA